MIIVPPVQVDNPCGGQTMVYFIPPSIHQCRSYTVTMKWSHRFFDIFLSYGFMVLLEHLS